VQAALAAASDPLALGPSSRLTVRGACIRPLDRAGGDPTAPPTPPPGSLRLLAAVAQPLPNDSDDDDDDDGGGGGGGGTSSRRDGGGGAGGSVEGGAAAAALPLPTCLIVGLRPQLLECFAYVYVPHCTLRTRSCSTM